MSKQVKSEGKISAMVGFMVFANFLLLLFPLALPADDDLPRGRTLLIETVDEPSEPEAVQINNENDKQENKLTVTERISKSSDDGNDYSLKWTNDACAGFQ